MSDGDKLQGVKASLIARFCMAMLVLFSFICGAFIAGVSLHDPDTCWLLALGKQIIDARSVPFTDPFSYTFACLGPSGAIDYAAIVGNAATAGDGRVFIAYQWLSEVVFYLSYMVGAGYGLVATCCFVLVSALIVMPLIIYQRLKSSIMVGGLMTVFGVVACCFHFLARPEVFSYFWWALTLYILAGYRYVFETTRAASPTIFLIPLMLLVWANMHTGFVYAFLGLGIFTLAISIECAIHREKPGKYEGFAWLSLLAAFGISLINPHGFGLWAYLPDLFFSPLNRYIVELQPISAKDLTEWTYYPFFIVSASVLAILIRNILFWVKRRHLPRSWLFTIIAVVTAIGGGIVSRRVIPFDTLFLVCEAAWLLRHTGVPFWEAGEHHDEHDTLLHKADHKLSELIKGGAWATLCLGFSLLGVYLTAARIQQPVIPQKSGAFSSPQKLIAFIGSQEKDLGRVFNDPQIGDMIIWHLQTDARSSLAEDLWRVEKVSYRPKVFIDTRYDMYGEPLVSDYYRMANCQSGWRDLFAKYNFDWVVLRKKQNLHKELRKMSDWKEIYSDSTTVLYVRDRLK